MLHKFCRNQRGLATTIRAETNGNDAQKIREGTKRDRVLKKVLRYAQTTWPCKPKAEERNLYSKRDELHEELGMVMWGHRVVI